MELINIGSLHGGRLSKLRLSRQPPFCPGLLLAYVFVGSWFHRRDEYHAQMVFA